MVDQRGDKSPYPSWEELRARSEFDPSLTIEEHMSRPPPPDPPGFAQYTFRNMWHLSGEFPACVSVLRVKRVEESAEPFFRSIGDGGTWHETADWPMTEPKVSSIDVSSYELKVLESHWVAFHLERCDDDGEWVEYGELGRTDLKPTIKEMKPSNGECRSDTKCLIRCCGQERPVGRSGQKLTVTPSPGHDFVTVKDYISGEFELCSVRFLSHVKHI